MSTEKIHIFRISDRIYFKSEADLARYKQMPEAQETNLHVKPELWGHNAIDVYYAEYKEAERERVVGKFKAVFKGTPDCDRIATLFYDSWVRTVTNKLKEIEENWLRDIQTFTGPAMSDEIALSPLSDEIALRPFFPVEAVPAKDLLSLGFSNKDTI